MYALSRALEKREPYGSFIKLRTRQKVWFFRILVSDCKVPSYVKALSVALLFYLIFPIDLIPDFIPVIGYVDDVAVIVVVLALVIRLTPRLTFDDIVSQAADH